jgi:diacylglycerol kinase family enzyme
MVTATERTRLDTMTVFIGNNALQLRDLALDVARCMKRDLLAVAVLKPVSRWGMLRILWRGIVKTLERDERLETFCVDSLTIKLPKRRMTVALDGEMFTMTSPLQVEAVPKVLSMRLPPKEPS